MMKYIKYILLAIFLVSCGSSFDTENKSAEEIFNKGVEYFEEEEDYLEAQKMFDLIKLQYPASQYADDAQFYLAEVDFARKKYILAAFNYNSVRRLYPTSPHNKNSLFKRALCFQKLSPDFDRDQEYTKKAIEAFQEFQYTYPNDSLADESNKYIMEMRNKLAHKEHFTAELYMKLNDPRAALIYFNSVINDYDDTDYIEDSYFGKIQSLFRLRRYDEAESIISLYKTKFPNGEYNDDIEQLRADISKKD